MSLVQFLKNPSVHSLNSLSSRCLRAAYAPGVHRKRIVLILLIFAVAAAQAQTPHRGSFLPARQSTASISPLYVQTAMPLEGRLLYKTHDAGLKRGKTMVALGGALQVAGVVLFVSGVHQNRNTPQNPGALHPDNGGGNAKIFLGVALVAAGTGVAVPGVVVWIKESKKDKRAMELQQSVRLNISPMPSLIYRF